MTEEWCRQVESRMVRLEEQVKVLAPVTLLREMIDPLRHDITRLVGTVDQLAESDLELKEMHKGLMIERARQEEARHQLELRELQARAAEAERLRDEARAEHEADKKNRGVLAWVSKKATPLMQFVMLVAALVAALYGMVLWLQAHYK